LSPEDIPKIAAAAMALYTERADRGELTGEYIIFAEHLSKKYYLCLSTHDEVRENSTALVERIEKGSAVQFPFLADQLRNAAT
jgi:hypothetical protein